MNRNASGIYMKQAWFCQSQKQMTDQAGYPDFIRITCSNSSEGYESPLK